MAGSCQFAWARGAGFCGSSGGTATAGNGVAGRAAVPRVFGVRNAILRTAQSHTRVGSIDCMNSTKFVLRGAT